MKDSCVERFMLVSGWLIAHARMPESSRGSGMIGFACGYHVMLPVCIAK